MYKYVSALSMVLLITFMMPGSLLAKEVVKEKTRTNSAEANFLTNTGCEDVSVGVNVTEKRDATGKGHADPIATIQVFGSFVDNCEFGNSTSFFGTTTVLKSEFKQRGTDSATLNKDLNIGGNEIHLSLVWKGVGVIGGEDQDTDETVNGVRVKKKIDVDTRNAEMSGEFVVNGLNRISDSSLVNAELTTIKSISKTVTK